MFLNKKIQPDHSLQQNLQEIINWVFIYSTYLKKVGKYRIKKSDYTPTSKSIPKPGCANKEIFYCKLQVCSKGKC